MGKSGNYRETEPGIFVRRLPLIARIGDSVSRNIRHWGFQEGSLLSLNNLGANLTVGNLTPEVSKVLEENPCIVVGNHPAFTDAIVLPAAIPLREDIFMVMSQSFLSLFPTLEPHILPIYLGARREREGIRAGALRKAFTYGDIDYEEAHRRNVQSITLAADRISSGELGIIFPAPLRPLREGEWKSGLGYLVNGLQNPSDAFLVEAYIEGTTNYDPLRAFHPLRCFYSDMRVTFRDPERVSDIQERYPAATERQLVTEMERDYLNWAKTIK